MHDVDITPDHHGYWLPVYEMIHQSMEHYGPGAFDNLIFSHDPMPMQVRLGILQSSCAVFMHRHAPTMSIEEQTYDALELSHHGNNSIL